MVFPSGHDESKSALIQTLQIVQLRLTGNIKFSINAIDGGRTPFTIEARAPSHSLYVDNGGRISFESSTPMVDLHVNSGTTPTLRLEQHGGSGFAPQIWYVASNEANSLIGDVTNRNTLPIKILTRSPLSDLFLRNTAANVLHDQVVGNETTAPSVEDFTLINKNAVPGASMLLQDNNSANDLRMQLTSNQDRAAFVGNPVEVGLTLFENGNVTILWTLTESSNKNAKPAIVRVDEDIVLQKRKIHHFFYDRVNPIRMSVISDRRRKTSMHYSGLGIPKRGLRPLIRRALPWFRSKLLIIN